MTFLLVGNNKTHKYRVYCPEVYGFETWGQNYQEELLKKRKSWYFTYWSGGYDEEDCYEESKANSDKDNVLLEDNLDSSK